MSSPGSTPEIYPLSEKYRLDLTLEDLIDQTSIITEDLKGINERLKLALHIDGQNINFLRWFKELKEVASEDESLLKKLNTDLYLQFYSAGGTALLPDYKYIDFKRIKDNGKLSRIRKYNKIASDPEAQGLLMAFAKMPDVRFFKNNLTVAKLKKVKFRVLVKLKKQYYEKLAELYNAKDPSVIYENRGGKLIATNVLKDIPHKVKKLFKTLQALSNKHQIFLYLSGEVPNFPYSNSMHLLTIQFIEKNFDAILESLKDYTFSQIINADDDEYILALRRWMDKNILTIEKDLKEYNHKNATSLEICYKDHSKKPRRLEAIISQETLLKLYPQAPWIKGKHGVVFNKNGKEIYFDKNIFQTAGRALAKLGHNLIQTETYLSLLAGTTTLVLTQGNVPLAMGTQSLVKNAIETARYDREWSEFLKDAPQEVINTFLLSSGFAAGRFYKILALGAGQGALQSYFTGQDIRTGALVGAGISLLQYYVIPTNISRPMTKGFDAKSLALNRRLETLEKSVRGLLQGSTVALIEGESIVKASIKGLLFGFVSAKVVIWFYGTRYYAFKDFDPAEVDEMMALENEYQNQVGRGGSYNINRQLILDANYRIGGVLPDMITASITLPGNVSVSDAHFDKLTVLTHEAHHLMQQHQSGVFGFYLFRYLPTSFITGYSGHPDENFLRDVLGHGHS